ncbi:MAG: phosphoribosylglycinamide formyltransferase [Pyrinomonadaceae bacterium]
MKIGILISGRGSNMRALMEAAQAGKIPGAEFVVVLSDQANATGLVIARERGVETVVVERGSRKRVEHDGEIIAALKAHQVELVCLAGYMRLLSPDFIAAFAGNILNIHPSLLPSFPGLQVQRKALEHGVKFAGCTVHFVDESLDWGPIIAQAVVPVLDDDTEESLTARILVEEHRLYPQALALIASGNFRIEGRRVIARDNG